jgi:hypothetical protein
MMSREYIVPDDASGRDAWAMRLYELVRGWWISLPGGR